MRSRFGRQSGGISFFAFQDIITGTSGFLIALALFLALNLDEKLTEGSGAEPYAKREDVLRSMLTQIVSEKNKVADYQQRPSDDVATLRRMIGQLKSTIAELDANPLPGMNRDADATGRDRELRAEKDKLLSRLEKMNAAAHEAEKLASGIKKDILDLEQKVIEGQSSLKRKRERQNIISLIPERSGTKKEPILVLVQSSLLRYQRADGAPGGSGSLNELVSYLRQTTPATHYVVFYFKPSGSPHFEMLTRRARQEGYEIGYDVIPEEMDVEFSNAASVKP
jgi:hypothetical protein